MADIKNTDIVSGFSYDLVKMAYGATGVATAVDATNPLPVTMTGSGNSNINVAQVNGATTQIAVNALNTTGAGVMATAMVGQYDDTSPGLLTENQFGIPRLSLNRNQYVQIRDGSGNDRGVGVTAGGSLQTVSTVNGDVASGTANSGMPLQMGGRAATTNPTAVADGQRVSAMLDKVGRQVVVQGHTRDLVGVQTTTITASTAETTIVTAVASTFLDLTHISLSCSSVTGTAVAIKDSTAGTTRLNVFIPAGMSVVIPFNPPLPQAAVNGNWTATCGTSTTSVYINATYVKNL